MNSIPRDAAESDLTGVKALTEHVLRTSLAESIIDLEEMLASANRAFDYWAKSPAKSLHQVVEQDDHIVGVILIKDFWNFVSLFVHPEYQGHGIGKSLLKSALDQCKDKSPIGEIRVNSADDSAPFYEKFGFSSEGMSVSEHQGVTPMRYTFK